MPVQCHRLQAAIGAHRDRVGDPLQQRQVIEGIRITPALGHRPAGQPQVQQAQFGGLIARLRGQPPGVAALVHFRLGGNQVGHTELTHDRCGDKCIGGGDHHQLVTGVAVTGNRLEPPGPHGRTDHLGHELRMQLGQPVGRLLTQKFQHKFIVGHRIQLAALVIGIKLVVFGAVTVGIHPPMAHQKFPPGMVRIQVQQGVIQIKQGQLHGVAPSGQCKTRILAACPRARIPAG